MMYNIVLVVLHCLIYVYTNLDIQSIFQKIDDTTSTTPTAEARESTVFYPIIKYACKVIQINMTTTC